jgi:hypothetical protein
MNYDTLHYTATPPDWGYQGFTFCGQAIREVRVIAVDGTDSAWMTNWETVHAGQDICPKCTSIRHLKTLGEVIL